MTDQSKMWVGALIALVIGWAIGSFVFPPRPQTALPAPGPAPVPEPPVSEKNVIQVTDTGFVPTTLNIQAGETITLVSKATAPVWPAGDPHPTHDAYPAPAYALPGDQAKSFGSKGCVEYGLRKGEVFDPCRLLLPNQTFTFRFGEKGTWRFHNHVRPEHTGTVIVE